MKIKSRFIQSVIQTSKSTNIAMPWARGKPRIGSITTRTAPLLARRVCVA